VNIDQQFWIEIVDVTGSRSEARWCWRKRSADGRLVARCGSSFATEADARAAAKDEYPTLAHYRGHSLFPGRLEQLP
jgi:hypothetical protein